MNRPLRIMNIKVTNATKDEIREFNLEEWHDVDVDHYGRRVEWNEQDFLFKATENGQVVGTISGKHESGVVYINTIIVARKKRKQGIGRALMKKAEEFGKKHKAHKLFLWMGKDWRETKFYQKVGFKKIATIPNHHFHKDFAIFSKKVTYSSK